MVAKTNDPHYDRGMSTAIRFTRLMLATGISTLLCAGLALAAEPLPGVVQGEPIVRPLPPEAGSDAEKEPIRVGDWDVRISGSVTIDIGTGNLPPPRSNR